jgi:hypothetical protein
VALYLGNDVVPARIDRYPARPPAEVHALRFPRRPTLGELRDALVIDFLEVRSCLFILIKAARPGAADAAGVDGGVLPG